MNTGGLAHDDDYMYRPPSYWFNIATDATKALNQLDSSQEPAKLVFFLTSLPLDGSLPVHHTAFWQSGLSSAWLNAILDQTLYQSFAVDYPVGRPDSAIPILSERSASALKLLRMTAVVFQNLCKLAWQFAESEALVQSIRRFVQHLPSLFELLWQHRHVVLRPQTGALRLETAGNDDWKILWDATQLLMVYYFTLHGSAMPSSPIPMSFVVHLGIYCWYRSSEKERRSYGLLCWISQILDPVVYNPEWCRNFAEEAIYPTLGPSPTDAIGYILRTDRGLTRTRLLRITMEFLVQLVALCPFIIKDTRDAEVLLTALATVAQRHHCYRSENDDIVGPPQPEDIPRISMGMLAIIKGLYHQLPEANDIRQIIVSQLHNLNFLPQIAHCIALAYREDSRSAIEAILLLVDIYYMVGIEERCGRLTAAKLSNYRQFQRVLEVYWQPILDQIQPPRRDTNPSVDYINQLRRIRERCETLGELLEGRPTGNAWNGREMLGCFNVECLCYGRRPLHKLRECKRCQTAHYCDKECQRKDWVARHRSICGRS